MLLGQFSTDLLEKEFSKLRQGSGGTYFINVHQIEEKTRMNRSKLLLSLKQSIPGEEAGHACDDCGFRLESDEKACEVVGNQEVLESSVPTETKAVLVNIAGYVNHKDLELAEEALLEQTTFNHQKYGQYTDSLDRGGLKVPSHRACQWTIFCFLIFSVVKNSVCRKSFSNISLSLSEMFDFEMEEKHTRTLSNILINNHCKFCHNPSFNKGTCPEKVEVVRHSIAHFSGEFYLLYFEFSG